MSNYRQNVNADGTPIQQSMTQDPFDYQAQNLNTLMLGVVLDVYPSDDEDGNSTSWRTLERRGHTHECTVLIIRDGTSAYLKLSNVVIPPYAPSGVDDYAEILPRGSSALLTGEELNAALHQIDPYDLDGDWCVVGFIGGQIDNPFIISWWPHARNTFDPATSGRGNPNTDGEGRALEQAGRYFRRINGVETVVSSRGDIIVSTTYAGSGIQPGEDPVNGRFARSAVDEGGDIRIYMKPSRTVEWTWDPQPDGVGCLDSREPELPQTNPQQRGALTSGDKEKTYININEERWRIQVPSSFEVISEDTASIEANNTVDISASDVTATGESSVVLEAPSIKLGENATDALIKGTTLNNAWTALTVAGAPAGTDALIITDLIVAVNGMIAALAASLASKGSVE